MAEIVGGFLIPHNPQVVSKPNAVEPSQKQRLYDAFAVVAKRLRALEVETVIIVGCDHYTMFGPHCIPQCLIGIGDVEGPAEDWLGISRTEIPCDEELALHILGMRRRSGIDWSFSKFLVVDHSVFLPYHFCVREIPGINIIPIYLNIAVPPVIQSRRAYEIGCSVLEAVKSWEKSNRVAVLGTGGISHWVGSAEMGQVNQEFDQSVLEKVVASDVDGLINMSDEFILQQGGNGGLEIKNWLCAMGMVEGIRANIIRYEAVPQWIAGFGFAELMKAA